MTLPLELERYNVLEIVWDTTRADHLSAYGYQRETTPFLESVMSEAIAYEHANINGSWTIPNVASMLTGLTPETHKMLTQAIRLDDAWDTTPEILASHGYATGMFSSNPVVLDRDRNLDQGAEHSEWMVRPDSLLTNAFFDFVDGHRGEPFFAHVQYYAAHGPYTPTEPFDSLFVGDPFYGDLGDAPGIGGLGCVGTIPASIAVDSLLLMDYYVAQYDALIAQSDHELSKLFDGLEARGILDSTLVILTADHGELLGGEQGRYFCHTTFYDGNNRVPLIVWFPPAWQAVHGEIRDLWLDENVSHIDLLPTIFSILGLPVPSQVQGVSLFQSGQRRPTLGHDTNYRMGYSGPMKVIHNGRKLMLSTDVERYDLGHDPQELNNLAPEDTLLSKRLSLLLLQASQSLRDIDPNWGTDTTFVFDDFEEPEKSSDRLFIAATLPEYWDWKIIRNHVGPKNHFLYGYVADTTEVNPDLWVTGTCAYIDSPRRTYEVEFDLALVSGAMAARVAWLSWSKTGFEVRFESDRMEIWSCMPDEPRRLVGKRLGDLPQDVFRVRIRLTEDNISVAINGDWIVQGPVPARNQCFGTVEFGLLEAATQVLIDNLEIRSIDPAPR